MGRAPLGAFKSGREQDKTVAIARYLAGDADTRIGRKRAGSQLLVEPNKANASRVVGHVRFEYRQAPLPRLFLPNGRNISFESRFLSFDRRGDLFYFREIFVARGNMEQKIPNRANAERRAFREERFFDGREGGNGSLSGDHTSRAFASSVLRRVLSDALFGFFAALLCALGRNRTCDLLDRNQTLYPLSYERETPFKYAGNGKACQ